jgi:hypothetical protein
MISTLYIEFMETIWHIFYDITVRVSGGRTVLQSSDGVDILDPDTGDTVFSTNQDYFRFPDVAWTIDAAQLVTDRVSVIILCYICDQSNL